MHISDRIKDLRRVRAGDLRPHPKNWRKHPEEQQNALRGILAEVGFVDALMVRELPDGGLQIVDGHLRVESTPDAEVPVLVVDLDEAEADKVLATFDPLAAMPLTKWHGVRPLSARSLESHYQGNCWHPKSTATVTTYCH
jgi:ParB-like chromosome segregation protein Spo0J